MLPVQWDKTQKGTIKYKRKKHEWTEQGILRLVKKKLTYVTAPTAVYDAWLGGIIATRPSETVEFGGGEFGGGGATRSFDEPDVTKPAEPRYIIILEEQ